MYYVREFFESQVSLSIYIIIYQKVVLIYERVYFRVSSLTTEGFCTSVNFIQTTLLVLIRSVSILAYKLSWKTYVSDGLIRQL